VPRLPPEAVRSIGNAAGAGAVLALLSLDMRRRARELARRIRYIELSARADFSARFVREMAFPHQSPAYPRGAPISPLNCKL